MKRLVAKTSVVNSWVMCIRSSLYFRVTIVTCVILSRRFIFNDDENDVRTVDCTLYL